MSAAIRRLPVFEGNARLKVLPGSDDNDAQVTQGEGATSVDYVASPSSCGEKRLRGV